MQDNMPYLIIIGAAVVALAALAALVNYVISIVRGFQEMRRADNPPRNPPLPEELAKSYVSKKEFAELKQELSSERKRVDGIFRELFAQQRDLTTQLGEWQRGIERLIGKIEGKVESK